MKDLLIGILLMAVGMSASAKVLCITDESIEAVAIAGDHHAVLLVTGELIINGMHRRELGRLAALGPSGDLVAYVDKTGVLAVESLAGDRRSALMESTPDTVTAVKVISDKGAGVFAVQDGDFIRLFLGGIESYSFAVEGTMRTAGAGIVWTVDESGSIRGYDLGGIELIHREAIAMFGDGLLYLDGENLQLVEYQEGRLRSLPAGRVGEGLQGVWSGHVIRKSGRVVRAEPIPPVK